MASVTYYPTLRSPRIAVPLLTALLGITGTAGGFYASMAPHLSAPAEPAKMFGIQPPTNLDTDSEADSRQRAYIQIHGLRNLVTGLTLLGSVGFWRLSPECQSSPAAAVAIQKIIAISLGLGSLVALGDGLLLKRYSWNNELTPEAKKLAQETASGHLFMSLPIVGLGAAWWYY